MGRTGDQLDFSWVRTDADIGSAIAALRAAHPAQPTLRWMANRAGVQSETTISNWLAGQLPLDEQKLDRLLVGLGADSNEREQVLSAFRRCDEQRRVRRQQAVPPPRPRPAAPAGRGVRYAVAAVVGALVLSGAALALLPARTTAAGTDEVATPIVSASSKLCVRPGDEPSGIQIRQYLCTRDELDWELRAVADAPPDTFHVGHTTSRGCLTATAQPVGGASATVLRDCANGDRDQWWIFDPTEHRDAWTYGRFYNDLAQRCLDVNQNSTAEGAPLVLWPCGAQHNQLFGIVRRSDGSPPTTPACPSCPTGATHEVTAKPGGANTFRDPKQVLGKGARLGGSQTVRALCRMHAPSMESAAWWYLVLDEPWNGQYYAPASSFRTDEPPDGPVENKVDRAIPVC